MSKVRALEIEDLLNIFENVISPSDVLASKLMAQISTAITRERIRLNMTQSEFARHIDVTQSQISRWERGDYNFTIEKIAKIAEKLDLDINFHVTNIHVEKKSVQNFSVSFIPLTNTINFTNKSTWCCSYNNQSKYSIKKEEENYVAVR